jgi:hypothetical protein
MCDAGARKVARSAARARVAVMAGARLLAPVLAFRHFLGAVERWPRAGRKVMGGSSAFHGIQPFILNQ